MSKYICSNQFWDTIQSEFSPYQKKDNGIIKVDRDFGKMQLNHFSTGTGINYSLCIATFYEDTILEGLYHNNVSFLLFNTGNDAQMLSKDKSNSINFNNGSFYNGKHYEGHKAQALHSKNKQYIFHYLLFENNLFENLTNEKQENKPMVKNDYFQLDFNNQISTKQKVILDELTNISNIDSKLQEIYLESKVLELTHSCISDINKPKKTTQIALSLQDIECLKKSRQILIDNIQNPPSLKELAYKSAINEFKLKKGFKQLFGNTVYGFLQEYRLTKAKKLLESQDINIGEVTTIVGYKNIGHFSTIFKEYFGISPIEIKKEQKKYYTL